MPDHLAAVFPRFAIDAPLARASPHGGGHIHDTYLAETSLGERFIFQRLNAAVFPDPLALMANLSAVTAHLGGKTRDPRRALQLVPARDGRTYVKDPEGRIWRAFPFISGTLTLDSPKTPDQAHALAFSFGAFLQQMADLPAPLHETLPRFHDTPWRFTQLRRALAADPLGRAAEAAPELNFAFIRESEAGRLQALLNEGTLPLRTVHNDAKAANLLFDAETGEGLCVIDLDTVMPGLALYDFGEMVRSGIGERAEDETGEVEFSLPRFESLVLGYLAGTQGLLTPAELDELAFAGRLMALENGVRFLADYLHGDVYYRTARPGHNLDRCRAQFALVSAMEAAEGVLRAIVERCLQGEPPLPGSEVSYSS